MKTTLRKTKAEFYGVAGRGELLVLHHSGSTLYASRYNRDGDFVASLGTRTTDSPWMPFLATEAPDAPVVGWVELGGARRIVAWNIGAGSIAVRLLPTDPVNGRARWRTPLLDNGFAYWAEMSSEDGEHVWSLKRAPAATLAPVATVSRAVVINPANPSTAQPFTRVQAMITEGVYNGTWLTDEVYRFGVILYFDEPSTPIQNLTQERMVTLHRDGSSGESVVAPSPWDRTAHGGSGEYLRVGGVPHPAVAGQALGAQIGVRHPESALVAIDEAGAVTDAWPTSGASSLSQPYDGDDPAAPYDEPASVHARLGFAAVAVRRMVGAAADRYLEGTLAAVLTSIPLEPLPAAPAARLVGAWPI